MAAAPDSLPAGLSSLQDLDLGGCRLAELPPALQGCAGLTRLAAGSNQLAALPEWLANLSGLQLLELSNNRLPEVPPVLQGLKVGGPGWAAGDKTHAASDRCPTAQSCLCVGGCIRVVYGKHCRCHTSGLSQQAWTCIQQAYAAKFPQQQCTSQQVPTD